MTPAPLVSWGLDGNQEGNICNDDESNFCDMGDNW